MRRLFVFVIVAFVALLAASSPGVVTPAACMGAECDEERRCRLKTQCMPFCHECEESDDGRKGTCIKWPN